MTTPLRSALLVLPALVAAGCSCNQDYVFPEPSDDVRTFTSDEIGDIGSWLSFDQAPDGARLTMAYYSRQYGAVGYAVGTPADDGSVVWSHEKVDGWPDNVGLDPGDAGAYTSQRTAPDGTVWVSYRDAKAKALKVAHRLGGGVWAEPEQVDAGAGSSPDAGFWTSLDIGADGNPVVVSCDNGSATVRVARYDGSAWTVTEAYKSTDVVVPATDTGTTDTVFEAGVSHAQLLIDGDDEYIAFYDAAQGALHVLEGSGASFTDTIVDDAGDVGQWPDMAVVDGDLVVAYHDVGEQDLRLATRSGGAWSTELVDDGPFRGADSEVFVRDGKVHIVYFDGHDNDAWLAVDEGGTWSLNLIGADGQAVGFHNEVVEIGGTWWAGSYDFTGRGLYLTTL